LRSLHFVWMLSGENEMEDSGVGGRDLMMIGLSCRGGDT